MQSSYALLPAQLSDIPILAKIAGEAFQNDRHTALKALPEYGGYNHETAMNEALTSWIGLPPKRGRLLKATDNETGEILGWVCWGLRGYDESPATVKAGGERASKEDQASKSEQAEEPKQGIARMKELTSDDMQRWMSVLMPENTKCLFIISIVVSPKHQGKGVGAALIRNGTEQADQGGVYCWVHSSEDGVSLFTKEGFKEVGHLDIDLDEFAREENMNVLKTGKEPDRKWGVYRFRYMK